jgi:hypothetical protein
MTEFEKSIDILAASYLAVHHVDALSFVMDDINCAIGLREWDKTHALYRIQSRIQQLEQSAHGQAAWTASGSCQR